MVNYLAMVEQNDGGGLLLFLLLGLLLIMFLAYLPRKEKSEKHDEDIDLVNDNEDTDADVPDKPETVPDYDAVKKKLYSAITAVFEDTLNNAGNIIIYSTPEVNFFEEPLISVITILLPNNMLYLKFDYKCNSKKHIKFVGDCVVKLDAEKQCAYIYTDCSYHDTTSDTIALAAAVSELVDCDIPAVLEV